MRNKTLMLILLRLMTIVVTAQEPKVTQIMSKDLTDAPGKKALMVIVEYPPGGADHYQHNA
jgi:hypothetical protein